MSIKTTLATVILAINTSMSGVYPTTYYEFYERAMGELSQVDESFKDTVRAAIAAGILGATSFSMYGKNSKTVSSPKNKTEQVATTETKIGAWDRSKLINIVARTLFMEARQDYKNDGLKAVASVIWNRADRIPANVVSVCFAKGQFSVWATAKPWSNPDYSPSSYVVVTPAEAKNNKIEEAAWNKCVDYATQMADNTFVSNIGNRNMYDRKRTEKNKSWFDIMEDKIVVGSQTFGYLSTAGKTSTSQNSEKSNVYVVARGDNLTSIAKKNNVSYADLLKKNPKFAKNPNSIKIGDKIVLPEKKNG